LCLSYSLVFVLISKGLVPERVAREAWQHGLPGDYAGSAILFPESGLGLFAAAKAGLGQFVTEIEGFPRHRE